MKDFCRGTIFREKIAVEKDLTCAYEETGKKNRRR